MTTSAPTGTKKVSIEFRPHDKVTRVPSGMTIFNAANWIGLPIDSTCGAKGTCGKCKVRILHGNNGATAADRRIFSEEELADGWRLSCRSEANSDVVCHVPRLMGNPKAALMGFARHVILNANVYKIPLTLTPPSLEDQRSDYSRIREALEPEGYAIEASLNLLRNLPGVLRRSQWQVTAVVVGNELVSVEEGDTSNRAYGLAFDIGTTTVVGMLIDLNSGAPVAVRSTLNGQAVQGADVISRISYTMLNEDGLSELNEVILRTLNNLISQLLEEGQVSPHEVYEVVTAGNATMQHLFLGVDPEAIGLEPFIPAVEDMVQASAQEVGLEILPQAQVHCLPYLGAYVGADLVAGLLATGLAQNEGVRLLVDVGTNGEIILGSAARTVATAAPAGPAFEGAQIQDGMRASEGAIEAVTITQAGIDLQVIGDVPPIGLCGSGLLDAVAQLRLSGLMLPSGRFVKANEAYEMVAPELARRIITDEEGRRSFVLAWPEESGGDKAIVLTQRDVRELQFAKGSIAGGIDVVMQELGIENEELVEIFLAGSFGSYINPQSARIIGLVPPVPVERIKAVGNAAGEGAKIALLSFRERMVARSLPEIVEYHELSGRGDFNDSFLAVLQFPELDTIGLESTAVADAV
ncbi:MAG: ASKHA domain-containing protein [Caldilineaceae bacterium]|nr:ASKHA domain-containing protein [Caldilineaceae bacterium]MDE0336847.1 ASKHA domain-containing protein [Caldilineaceae bacterium]